MDVASCSTTYRHQVETASIAEAAPFDGSTRGGGPRCDASSEQNLVPVQRRTASALSARKKNRAKDHHVDHAHDGNGDTVRCDAKEIQLDGIVVLQQTGDHQVS